MKKAGSYKIKKQSYSYKKKAPSTKQLAKRVKKLEHIPEMKYKDISMAGATGSTTGEIYALSSLAQSDSINGRVGLEITSRKFDMDMTFECPPGVTGAFVRVLLVRDKDPEGLGPTVFADGAGATGYGVLDNGTLGNTTAPYNYRPGDRYKVYFDRLFTFKPNSSSMSDSFHFKKSFNVHGMKTKYIDSGATFASVNVNGFYFLWFTNALATGTVVKGGIRHWFTDVG